MKNHPPSCGRLFAVSYKQARSVPGRQIPAENKRGSRGQADILLMFHEYSRHHRPITAGATAFLAGPTDRATIRRNQIDRKTGCSGIRNYSQLSQ